MANNYGTIGGGLWPVRTAPSGNPGAATASIAGWDGNALYEAWHGFFCWAVLDGVVPYSDQGLRTFLYWQLNAVGDPNQIAKTAQPIDTPTFNLIFTNPDKFHSLAGFTEELPSGVRDWFAAILNMPDAKILEKALEESANFGGNPAAAGTPAEMASVALVGTYDPTARFAQWARDLPVLPAQIRRLQQSDTIDAWPAPAGGTLPPDPGLGPNCVNCDAAGILIILEARANAGWIAAVGADPTLLAVPGYETMPYPQLGLNAPPVLQGTGELTRNPDGSFQTTVIGANSPQFAGLGPDGAPIFNNPTPVDGAYLNTLLTPTTVLPVPVASPSGGLNDALVPLQAAFPAQGAAAAPVTAVSAQPGATVSATTNTTPGVQAVAVDWNKIALYSGIAASLGFLYLLFKGKAS